MPHWHLKFYKNLAKVKLIMKFKVGDQVLVTAGKDKGKTGEITRIYRDKNKVLVKGVNFYKRHVKPREGIEGGILDLERPLPVSNVAIIDPTTKKPTRIGYQILDSGKKVRIAKASGTELDKPKKTSTTKTKSKTKK